MSRQFWNGNTAAAQAVRLSRVQVIAAYPITPQTALVEDVASDISNGRLDARMITVESEHSAMSACAGASVVGARTFTATSSQGLIYMSEVLHMTSGCRLPVVMAVVHRAMSAPINTSADQQDSMLQRDSGWIILECKSAQEILDTIPMAYRIAEDPEVHLPVMVCFDGYTISHTSEEVEGLSEEQADALLAPVAGLPRPILDVDNPVQLNQLLPADGYAEYQYKKHTALRNAGAVIERTFQEFAGITGRAYSGVETYLCEDADVILVGMGSLMSTARWVVNKLREEGEKVGLASVRQFRPFPEKAFLEATGHARVLAVMDKNIGLGTVGIMFTDIARVLYNEPVRPKILSFILGLGGRSVSPEAIERCYATAKAAPESIASGQTIWADAAVEGL